MKGIVNKVKRNVARESVCVNTARVWICAAVCAILGLIFALGGIDLEVYEEIVQPKFYLPPFFMIFFSTVFYAVLGAAAGTALSTPYYRKNNIKLISIVLSVCTLFLCFTWVPLVYTAASFLIGAFVYILVLLFSSVIFKFFFRINRMAAWLVLIFAVYALYMVCYSLTLFIIN
ncbi:MAG: tryptophan-rich sensory protein [Clostridia bacterium]|nr:tryptophan-rich sensory protein [Clostridia bacterium]